MNTSRTAVTVSVLVALACGGCGGEDSSPVTSGATQAEVAAVSSDAKTVATAMEVYYVDHATYATSASELDVPGLTGAVQIVSADASSFRICVTDAASGAWASLDSTSGTVVDGDTGAACP